MMGLIALSILGGWIFLSLFLARRIPRWLGVQRYTRSASIACFLLVLIAPVIQDIVGMWQFDRLCKERVTLHVSPDADQVKRAIRANTQYEDISGYWVNITAQQIAYLDAATGLPFLSYEILHTKGGVIGAIALLGGDHSCSPPDMSAMKRLDIDKLVK